MKCYSVVYRFKGDKQYHEKFFNTAQEADTFRNYLADHHDVEILASGQVDPVDW